jgi:hypothetical protein
MFGEICEQVTNAPGPKPLNEFDGPSATRHVALAAAIIGYSANIVVVSSAVHSVGSAGFLIWHDFRFAIDPETAPTDEASAAALHRMYTAGVAAVSASVGRRGRVQSEFSGKERASAACIEVFQSISSKKSELLGRSDGRV